MKNKKIIGNVFFITISFIAILFFFFGLMLIIVSLRNLILSRFRLSLVQILYLIIGIYIVYNSIKRYVQFYKNAITKPYIVLNNFYKNNKIEVGITTIISLILLFIYYNGLYLNYNFILKMILFFPIFVFQNLIFVAKVFSKATLRPIFFSEIFDLLLPVVEVYYVFSITKFVLKLSKKQKSLK